MAKDAFWFRHDANARNDIKIIDLRAEHGYEGYGIYFAILEVLREQDGYKLPISKRGRLAVALGESAEIVNAVVDTCIECGLFVEEDGYILSLSFVERMASWEAKKLNGSKPKAKSKRNDKLNENIREENIREENRRQEDRREDNRAPAPVSEIPSLDQCKTTAQMDGFTADQGEAYYHMRNANGWCVPRGKDGNLYPIVNWRSDMATAIRKGYVDREVKASKPLFDPVPDDFTF